MTSKRPPLPGSGVVDAATGIARGAARTWVQTVLWGTRTSLRAARGLTVAATDRDAAVELVHGAATGMRGRARDFLGVADLDERIGKLGLSGNEQADQRGRNGTVADTMLRARARSCCASQPTSLPTTELIPRTRACSTSSLPMRPGYSGCSRSTGPSPWLTCAR